MALSAKRAQVGVTHELGNPSTGIDAVGDGKSNETWS